MLKQILVTILTTLSVVTVYDNILNNAAEESHIKIKLEKKFGEFADNPEYKPIIRLYSEKGVFFCTGFVIDKNYAITAAHCLNDNGKLRQDKIRIENEENTNPTIFVKAAGIAARSDLGLLVGDFSQFKPLSINVNEFAFLGKLYAACGYAYGSKQLSCNMFIPQHNENFMVKGLGYLVPGMSGGPVIDVENSTVSGLNTAVANGGILVSPLQGLLGSFGID